MLQPSPIPPKCPATSQVSGSGGDAEKMAAMSRAAHQLLSADAHGWAESGGGGWQWGQARAGGAGTASYAPDSSSQGFAVPLPACLLPPYGGTSAGLCHPLAAPDAALPAAQPLSPGLPGRICFARINFKDKNGRDEMVIQPLWCTAGLENHLLQGARWGRAGLMEPEPCRRHILGVLLVFQEKE